MAAVATTNPGVRLARLILPVALVLCSLLSACGGSGSSGPPTTLGPNDIEVADFTFAPPTLTVKVGTTVTWHFDQPSAPHNVVSLTTPVLFNSGTPKGTGTYSFTFTTPGTFPYLCQIHPSMKGTIIVTP
jgi:plastocyanin